MFYPRFVQRASKNCTRVLICTYGMVQDRRQETLTLSKYEGGIGLCNLKVKGKSLKTTWVKILAKEEKLSNICYENFCPYLTEAIWSCNLHPKDVKYVCQDPFWMDVLSAWSEYKQKADEISEPQDQIIWYNSSIRVQNKPFVWRKGLMDIDQLFERGFFLSNESAKERFGITIMEYNALKSAIPQDWINYLKKNSMKSEPKKPKKLFYESAVNNVALSRQVYKALLSDGENVLEELCIKWAMDLDFIIDIETIRSAFKDIYLVTNVPKYRSFQYPILHRSLVTNTHLFKWNKRENDYCAALVKSKATDISLLNVQLCGKLG